MPTADYIMENGSEMGAMGANITDGQGLYDKVYAVAVADGNKQSDVKTFTKPTIRSIGDSVTKSKTTYYAIEVDDYADGLYIAAVCRVGERVEFTFTQVTANTEVAVKTEADSVLLILFGGRTDLTVEEYDVPVFDISNQLTSEK